MFSCQEGSSSSILGAVFPWRPECYFSLVRQNFHSFLDKVNSLISLYSLIHVLHFHLEEDRTQDGSSKDLRNATLLSYQNTAWRLNQKTSTWTVIFQRWPFAKCLVRKSFLLITFALPLCYHLYSSLPNNIAWRLWSTIHPVVSSPKLFHQDSYCVHWHNGVNMFHTVCSLSPDPFFLSQGQREFRSLSDMTQFQLFISRSS